MSIRVERDTAWSRLRQRWRRAIALDASGWNVALGLLIGAMLAAVVVPSLPATGSDLAKARTLGIISRTTLDGYPKSADQRGYWIGMLLAVGTGVGVWMAWAARAGGPGSDRAPAPARRGGGKADRLGRRRRTNTVPAAAARDPASPAAHASPGSGGARGRFDAPWIEATVMLVVIAAGFFKLDMARNAWTNSWTFLSEEGEMMAWVDVLHRGGALFRDVYCLYGPLSKYPVALIFSTLGPSLWRWRVWLYALNVPALLMVYALLRGLMRTRAGAAIGTLVIGLVCASTLPAMSWSIARVASGLGVIAALHAFRVTGRRAWLPIAGILLGGSLGFSQEVGVCAGVATVWMLAARWWADRVSPPCWIQELGLLVAGVALVIVPLVVHFIRLGTLADAVQNLFVFPRVRLLGFGALRFPAFPPMFTQMLSGARDGRIPALVAVGRFYFCPAALAIAATVVVVRLVSGRDTSRAVTAGAVCVFGVLVFQSALSRPDGTHLLFVMPPALVLVACGIEDSLIAATSAAASGARRSLGAAFALLWLAALAAYADILTTNLKDYVRQAGLTLSGRFSRDHVAGFRPLHLPRTQGIQVPGAWAAEFEPMVDYVRARTSPGAPLWEFPNEPLVNFVADRPLASPYPLGLFAITRGQREQMVAAIERAHPAYAVFFHDAIKVDGIPYDVALPEPTRDLEANYELDRRFGPWLVLHRIASRP